MEIADYIQVVETQGQSLADAAQKAGVDAPVTTCPDWRVRDLVRHQGAVHRWAASYLAEGHTERRPFEDTPDLDGDELLSWFREGHRHLVDTLTGARPDVACWAFFAAPSPLAFWARRQAHETTVHRVDAESALTSSPEAAGAAIGTDFAVDGIDELLFDFHGRERSRMRSDLPRVLRVRATDANAAWTVRITQDPPVAERGTGGEADCEVSGPAARLYLALWNRLPFAAVSGDASIAELWRERSGV
ncbi:maleylpyruvate isomerase family mycothiol-dependent enzyme [Streptomyces beihaiensis]|uniref:Maleylpyruvate isomerase family mycothiol-dependent enzyme n=1 Tax=Streptomyces beihaiensis TaxID=2984495 RepID=A0ABT3TYV7_9ACTN|nr:maleylpyruvate isomerase family mycothiol-dependent enzyme [Streptomyces beihaiensis]MCX3062225.1 maleylpyruvate isomerase family mycothiol-dependent enzyme [Streptomyces beihaiensis]